MMRLHLGDGNLWTPNEHELEIAFDWPVPAVRPIDLAESRLRELASRCQSHFSMTTIHKA